jgi:hypothetical protein
VQEAQRRLLQLPEEFVLEMDLEEVQLVEKALPTALLVWQQAVASLFSTRGWLNLANHVLFSCLDSEVKSCMLFTKTVS